MASKYQEIQRAKSTSLLLDNDNNIFSGSHPGGYFMSKARDFVLVENETNLFPSIRNDSIEYFKKNKISWWGGSKPTGHLLSSQISCLNHLFQIRNDKQSVLDILSSISNDFKDVLPIITDKHLPSFIQFESVSDNDNLNEITSTRGSNCTSIDALIYAVHKDGSNWIIPIEWKYTEFYNNQNKATEGCKNDPTNCKGEVRKKRYSNLINSSSQLNSENHLCYYFEPFYQLMRQTLWAEGIIRNQTTETIKATNYLHVHVIPEENEDLLKKEYPCSELGMEATWRKHLVDQSKYLIITPKNLMSKLDSEKHKELLNYLNIRYWQ